MKPLKVKTITKLRNDKVYDIKHLLDSKHFLNNHPNLIANDLIISNCSRHAGGVVVGENLDYYMPLINSDGVRQTPWSEGQNVRHLEPMGFIKFDILGLATLKMIESSIRHILKRHKGMEEPTFEDIKKFYNENLNPEKMDLSDKKVYQNIFHEGKWVGVFQFTERGAQDFCKRVKPNNIIDLSAITSIYRPGPLSANVDQQYAEAKEHPSKVKYLHPLVKEVTKETYGFLIFQEQIALLAHKLGKNVSLEEGNKLRKLLTKKGTGKGFEEKDKIHGKFIEGCVEKGIDAKKAQQLWETFEYFSGYGFNKSHAVCYSILSYQCAWLATYYESEWLCAFLEKEAEQDTSKDDKINRKEKAINTVKSLGYNISSLNINKSGRYWEISDDGSEFIPPLTSIKGLGEAAMFQILNNRPFNNVEDFLFNEKVSYSKLNKKALDVLIRAGACDNLIDSRFTGAKHFWSAAAVDRPKTKKVFHQNIELYRPEGDFTQEEKIEYLTDLTGEYPISMVLPPEVAKRLEEKYVPPIGEYDPELSLCWFVVRNVAKKTTSTGKEYLVIEVIDDTNTMVQVRCWGVKPNENVLKHRVYMGKLDYDPSWGFSVKSITSQLKIIA